MTIIKEKLIIPKLRFEEFSDEWQTFIFSNLFERVTTKNIENNQNILTISAQEGLVNQEKFFTKLVAAKDVSGYYLLHKNDFAYNKSYSKGYPMGAIKRLVKHDKGVVSTLYFCFRTKEQRSVNFFEQFFNAGKLNVEMEKIAQEGARNHGLLNMSITDFFKMLVTIPSTGQQEKIADFLTAVDEKISLLEAKKEKLEKYKKGVMQAIFNQKIRFKKEDGASFSDWKTKRFDEIFDISAGGDIAQSHVKKIKDNIYKYPIYSNSESEQGLYGYSDIYIDITL
jgi:type I restriction enzyme S subunit